MAEKGNLDEAVQILRARADAGDKRAAWPLADLRAALVAGRRGRRWDGRRERPRADDAERLAELLAEHGDLRLPRAWVVSGVGQNPLPLADTGGINIWSRLADQMAESGYLDELRAQVDAGDWDAARLLPEVLIRVGRGEEAERLRRFGLNPDGSIASE